MSPIKKPKCKVKKQVRFNSSAKTWDGKRREHILLEQFSQDYRQFPPNLAILDKLYNARDEKMLLKMRDVLIATMERIRRNPDGVVLIPAGGNLGIKMNSSQLPHAKRMLASIEEMYDAAHLMCFCEF